MSAGGAAFSYEAHSAVVMSSKEVYTWGWNIFGQLGTGIGAGTGTQATQGIPRGIPWLARKKLKSIVCGQFSTAAVTQDGELYMWGLNEVSLRTQFVSRFDSCVCLQSCSSASRSALLPFLIQFTFMFCFDFIYRLGSLVVVTSLRVLRIPRESLLMAESFRCR